MSSTAKSDCTDVNEHSSSAIVEDDQLRSRYVMRLVEATGTSTYINASSVLPRVLIQFWDNAKNIPADVQECIDSWQPLDEKDFKRLLFDDTSAKQFIADNFDLSHLMAFERCAHPAMRSDYFRLCFILINGGFYVDTDDVYQGRDCESWFSDDRLKLQPLCYNVSTDSMVDTTDFLTNPEASPDLIYYVNNNPLIAPPRHPVIRMALERSTGILLNQSGGMRDIQSITGPGNLTACLVQHDIESKNNKNKRDFTFLTSWDSVSVSKWPLEYRDDERNWRHWAVGNA